VPQSMGELISITNQENEEDEKKQSSPKPTQSSDSKDKQQPVLLVAKAISDDGKKKVFKLTSKNQIQHRAQKASKMNTKEVNTPTTQMRNPLQDSPEAILKEKSDSPLTGAGSVRKQINLSSKNEDAAFNRSQSY
jgi:hypothetical protein